MAKYIHQYNIDSDLAVSLLLQFQYPKITN